MKAEQYKKVYFIGIGGIGMSAIARYFLRKGLSIAGYDKTETSLTDELISEGMKIHFDDDINLIPDEFRNAFSEDILIVFTPAVPSSHSELNYFKSKGSVPHKRSEVLGLITRGAYSSGIAGTHGKTTTSSLLAHILRSSGKDCSAFLGGITANYNSNFLLQEKDLNNPKVVVEADEFDRSFLTLNPDIAVITSTDADHLDIYGKHEQLEESFIEYASRVKENGYLIIKSGLNIIPKLNRKYFSYSIEKNADFKAENIQVKDGEYHFDLVTPEIKLTDLKLGIPGQHNVENAVAASAAALLQGVGAEELREALKSFLGVKRRFEYIIRRNDFVLIDDYAHHPEELRACIQSVRQLFPGKKLTAVFQPHLYSRTKDFADGFAKSLSMVDRLILLDIYPARELPLPGVTSDMILEKVTIVDKTLSSKEDLLLNLEAEKCDVLLMVGAGDIDQLVDPVKELFERKK